MKLAIRIALAAGLALSTVGSVQAENACAKGNTIKPGVLTVATSQPAYFPWVIDNKPQSGKGYEAAVAYAIAHQMGFTDKQVVWTRTTFDQAIQPGQKNFDLNFQQYTITKARAKNIDFSLPYYTAAAAVVVRKPTVEKGAKPTLASLATLRWGAAAGATAIDTIKKLVHPSQSVMIYNDTADMTQALKSNQIDAIMVDLPTALYITAVELKDGVVLGQFTQTASGEPDQFGAVMPKGSKLKPCVDAAIKTLTGNGTIKALEQKWLEQATNVPVVK